ncbi:unnamed protein product [Caenorhabditis angaria]|uniref:Uncharacterized protein n=1 Tax=Caenorhabditis angaria TaxID=860376 RepID=A0A9P1MZL2_9PELO|nr:unnamed protein product [Caenorhabditis angaria]
MSISISCSADFKLKQIHAEPSSYWKINSNFDILVTRILILGYEASWIGKRFENWYSQYSTRIGNSHVELNTIIQRH